MFLTRRQKDLLDYIESFIGEHGYAPTLDEISRHFGLSSLATVHKHLTNLEQKGIIRRTSNYSRAIELIPQGGEARARPLQVLGHVAAGKPIESFEHPDTAIAVPEELLRSGNSYVLRAVGNSMIDDGIWNGDYLVVSERSSAEEGETVIAVVEEGATVKRFYREKGGKIRLQPANETMQPMIYPANEVTIRGVVVAVMRKY